jgi:hypothetical protein
MDTDMSRKPQPERTLAAMIRARGIVNSHLVVRPACPLMSALSDGESAGRRTTGSAQPVR